MIFHKFISSIEQYKIVKNKLQKYKYKTEERIFYKETP